MFLFNLTTVIVPDIVDYPVKKTGLMAIALDPVLLLKERLLMQKHPHLE